MELQDNNPLLWLAGSLNTKPHHRTPRWRLHPVDDPASSFEGRVGHFGLDRGVERLSNFLHTNLILRIRLSQQANCSALIPIASSLQPFCQAAITIPLSVYLHNHPDLSHWEVYVPQYCTNVLHQVHRFTTRTSSPLVTPLACHGVANQAGASHSGIQSGLLLILGVGRLVYPALPSCENHSAFARIFSHSPGILSSG